jgi:hypothetical protein
MNKNFSTNIPEDFTLNSKNDLITLLKLIGYEFIPVHDIISSRFTLKGNDQIFYYMLSGKNFTLSYMIPYLYRKSKEEEIKNRINLIIKKGHYDKESLLKLKKRIQKMQANISDIEKEVALINKKEDLKNKLIEAKNISKKHNKKLKQDFYENIFKPLVDEIPKFTFNDEEIQITFNLNVGTISAKVVTNQNFEKTYTQTTNHDSLYWGFEFEQKFNKELNDLKLIRERISKILSVIKNLKENVALPHYITQNTEVLNIKP